jgi:competence protein ComEC
MIWLPLGQWLALPAYLFLAWLTEGARVFASLPYAAVQLPSFPLWLLLAYYAIVVGGWLLNQWAAGTARAPKARPLRAPEHGT